MQDPKKLRELASWYREFAERTGNPVIWDCRLQTADNLEAEAERIERARSHVRTQSAGQTRLAAGMPERIAKG